MDLPRQASDDRFQPARQTSGWCEQALLQSCFVGLSSYASKVAVSIRCRNELLCDRFRPKATARDGLLSARHNDQS